MRLTIDREQLLKGIGTAARAIPPKAVNPILLNLRMEMNEKGLVLTGSDNEISIRTIVPYMIGDKEIIRNSKPGETLVACRLIYEIVRHLEGTDVTLELIDQTILRIDDGRSNFKLNTESPERYPSIDFSPAGALFELKASDFSDLVESTAFAASTKEARPLLTAVNLAAGEGALVATATDTARLARKRIEIDGDVRFSANVPARKLLDIARSLEGVDVIEIAVSDQRIVFDYGNTTISSRLVSGEYPNTRNIVPKTFNYYLEVNSREFLQTMERVSLLSADRDGVVKLILTEDEAEMVSRSAMIGSADEKLQTFRFSGERLEINFRASFVADAIRAIRAEDVTIAFIGEMKPFVVKNVKDDTIDMLITPLRS